MVLSCQKTEQQAVPGNFNSLQQDKTYDAGKHALSNSSFNMESTPMSAKELTFIGMALPRKEEKQEEIKIDIKPAPSHHFEPGGVPIFEPTFDEFKDFKTYVQSIESYGMKFGLIKIIPPAEWSGKFLDKDAIEKFVIKHPIIQQFDSGGLKCGIYRQLNIEKKRILSIKDWYKLSTSNQFDSPVLLDNITGQMLKYRTVKKQTKKTKVDQHCIEREVATEEIIRKPKLFNAEYLTHLEKFYWKNICFQDTMYAADILGSLFKKDCPENTWNISKLDNLLNRYPPIPGVNIPYLYLGMYKSTFAWHVEDMDLCSINYIHFGAPKQWYVVPPAQRLRFEAYAKQHFHEEAKICPEFLRHKFCVISPSVLSNNAISVHKLVQYANEVSILYLI